VKRLATSLLFALGLLAGCDKPYRRVAFELESTPPTPVHFDSDHISLVVGVAVQVKATPKRARRAYDFDVRFSLQPEDAKLLSVLDGQGRHEFVFVGLSQGSTCIDVRVDGHEEECIPVDVGPAP